MAPKFDNPQATAPKTFTGFGGALAQTKPGPKPMPTPFVEKKPPPKSISGNTFMPMMQAQPVFTESNSASKSNEICSFFQQGKCKYGDSCKKKHELPGGKAPKTKVPCKFFFGESKHCIKGDQCPYSHEPESGFQ
jgi:hypothetical protein